MAEKKTALLFATKEELERLLDFYETRMMGLITEGGKYRCVTPGLNEVASRYLEIWNKREELVRAEEAAKTEALEPPDITKEEQGAC